MLPRRAICLAIVVSVTCGLTGCGSRSQSAAKTSAQPNDSRSPSVGPPITDEESVAFCKSLRDALESGDALKFNNHIDWEVLIDRASANLGTPEVRAQMKKGAMNELVMKKPFATALTKEISGGGSMELLHLNNEQGRRSALFRTLFNNDSLSYLNMELARRPGGQIKVVDIYQFSSGEVMSQSLRRSFIPIAAHGSRSFLAKLTKSENDYMKNVENIITMTTAVREDRPKDFMAIYHKLPPSLQKEKTVLVLRLKAAMGISDTEYASAIEDLRKTFPHDAALDLLSIDGYIMKKQHRDALACVDRLDKSVGGDPYLDSLRAGLYLEEGEFADARKFADAAVIAASHIVGVHWMLVAVTLKQQDFDATLAALKRIYRDFGFEAYDLSEQPDYAEFRKSPQYQAWLTYLKETEAPAPTTKPAEKQPSSQP